jgi:hypothetical protein
MRNRSTASPTFEHKCQRSAQFWAWGLLALPHRRRRLHGHDSPFRLPHAFPTSADSGRLAIGNETRYCHGYQDRHERFHTICRVSRQNHLLLHASLDQQARGRSEAANGDRSFLKDECRVVRLISLLLWHEKRLPWPGRWFADERSAVMMAQRTLGDALQRFFGDRFSHGKSIS